MCNMEQMWNYSNYFLRYLVASRDIQPGTTILLDKPLAVGPHAGGALQCISCGFGVLISLNYICKLYITDIPFKDKWNRNNLF